MIQKSDTENYEYEMVENLVASLHFNITDHVTTRMIRGVATIMTQTDRGQILRYLPHTVISLNKNSGMTSLKDERRWFICDTYNSLIDQIESATTLGASVISHRLVMSEAVAQMWYGA